MSIVLTNLELHRHKQEVLMCLLSKERRDLYSALRMHGTRQQDLRLREAMSLFVEPHRFGAAEYVDIC